MISFGECIFQQEIVNGSSFGMTLSVEEVHYKMGFLGYSTILFIKMLSCQIAGMGLLESKVQKEFSGLGTGCSGLFFVCT